MQIRQQQRSKAMLELSTAVPECVNTSPSEVGTFHFLNENNADVMN